MGTYFTTQIGVFIQVKEEKAEKLIDVIRHPETGEKMNTKFDPDSGVEGVIVPESIYETQQVSGFIESDVLDVDTFWRPAYDGAPKGYAHLLLNATGRYTVGSIDGGDDDCVDLSNTDSDMLKMGFKKEYKDYLDYFKELYGADNVEVKFGVVNYAH